LQKYERDKHLGVGQEVGAMTPEEQERLQACTQEIAEILYDNSDKAGLKTLEEIEQTVRQQMLKHVSSEIAFFLSTMKLVQLEDAFELSLKCAYLNGQLDM
jgi:hypothetical protein